MKPMYNRSTVISRKTKETEIDMELNLDGSGIAQIETGIGFFNHMLDSFTRHGFLDLKLSVKGDLYVDSHHTVEDTGIVLGQAIKKALGDKQGIKRYGSFVLPMDETLVLCAIDLSGRPYLSYDLHFSTDRVGYMETELVKEFFYAVSYNAGMNLHIRQLSGENNHHIIEATFKAFAKALDEACSMDERIQGVLSTKGTI
jgi:imidazoleglycerol-phosphate dehydratase